MAEPVGWPGSSAGLYNRWHEHDPSAGHDATASQWRAEDQIKVKPDAGASADVDTDVDSDVDSDSD